MITMVNLIEVLCEVSVEELLKQQSELQNTRDKCATGIAVLELCINAARVAQRSKAKLVAPPPGPPVTEVEATPVVGADEKLDTLYERKKAERKKLSEMFGSVRINPELYQTPSDTIVGSPVAAQERIHTIERAPSDTSEEDAAAEVEAVFAERASEEVKPVVEEVAVPPAEVVTTPTPTPEPPITKPRSLSPDARNQQLSICDRAKIYLEFAYNATAMAIGKGIDLPDPTCMVKHLQKDSRFVKDPRGFWKLAGT